MPSPRNSSEAGRSREPAIDPELLKELRRIQIRTDRLVTDVVSGGYQSVFRGSGIEFDEVREWTEGDDVRAVDWNVTARQGRPFIKKYVEERELTVLLLLDRSRSMQFGSGALLGSPKSLARIALEFCACIGLSAARNNDKVGLVAFGGAREQLYVPPKKGRAQLLRILRDAIVPPEKTRVVDEEQGALARAMQFAGHVQRKRAIVFVLSDFLLGWPQRELRLLARRHDVTLVPCLDDRMLTLPRAGLLRLRDLESGEERLVDTEDARVRDAYAKRSVERMEKLETEARISGASSLPITTSEAVTSRVVAYFRRREMQGRHR